MDNLQSGDPAMVGPYRLIGRLGVGGMGQVYLGTSPGGRRVAVKLIHPQHANEPQFRERFAREIEAARRVGGFHTAPVVDADSSASPPWMVTAYIPGPSLQAAVAADGPFDEPAVRALGAGLAGGLAAIHACGLVHRDVKPSNVILSDDGPRIIDFGIARAAEGTGLTTTGAVLGTFSYMSPEQVRGEHAGPASDVFALGATLAFAATGRSPFGGESIANAVHRIVSQPPDLTGLPDGELRELIGACLAKDPAQRPSVSGILARLGAPGQPAGSVAAPSSAPPSSAPPSAREASTDPGADTQTERGDRVPPATRLATERRRPRVTARVAGLAATGVVVVAAVAVLAASLLSSPGRAGSGGGSASSTRPATPSPTAPATPPRVGLAGVYSASQYGFNVPYDIAAYGNDVWVANGDGNSVTELNASNGDWIQTLGGSEYGFDQPIGILDDGKHLWITNTLGNSLTELSASDGSFIRTLSGGHYGFNEPEEILSDGEHLWITNIGNSVTEVNASDGAWIRTLSGAGYEFNYPLGEAFDGSHIWIANFGENDPHYSVTEINASDGSLVRVVSGPQYRFNEPAHVAVADGSIWVTNPNGNTVTEINAANGALIRVLSGGDYDFGKPSGIGLFGASLLVTNISANSVDLINAANGALERIVTGPEYGFDDPNSITIADSRAWVGNWLSHGGSGSVTALKLG
jgi:serine/threonine protein kinase